MRAKLAALLVSSGFLVLAIPGAQANTVTFVTPTGATTGGGPVNASATFTTGTNSLNISLSDLQANPTDVAQLISDLDFTLSNGAITGTLSTSSAQLISINTGGIPTLGATVPTGWALNNNVAGGLQLTALDGASTSPSELILGPSGAGNVYSNANGSIAGNPAHNPFLNQSALFTLSIAGLTAGTTVTSAIFSFGTTAGVNITGVPSTVPIPGALPLFATGLAGLGLLGWRRKRKAQAA